MDWQKPISLIKSTVTHTHLSNFDISHTQHIPQPSYLHRNHQIFHTHVHTDAPYAQDTKPRFHIFPSNTRRRFLALRESCAENESSHGSRVSGRKACLRDSATLFATLWIGSCWESGLNPHQDTTSLTHRPGLEIKHSILRDTQAVRLRCSVTCLFTLWSLSDPAERWIAEEDQCTQSL